ncbi:hypothetical protein DLJ46_26920, partial [Micromonospora globispora]
TTVVAIAHDGEWIRRRTGSPRAAAPVQRAAIRLAADCQETVLHWGERRGEEPGRWAGSPDGPGPPTRRPRPSSTGRRPRTTSPRWRRS